MSGGLESGAGGKAAGAPARQLAEDEVQVWAATLAPSDEDLVRLAATLAEDQLRRCQALTFERHRRLFVARHGWLRALLSSYVGLAPERLRFVYGSHGKPALAPECGPGDLRFNLSHSDTVAVVALARGREVGVDVEALRAFSDAEQIAERFFSQQEREVFRRLPAECRTEAFFNCWTRKEAYVKARGDGLSCPLDSFDVSFVPGEPARVERVENGAAAAEGWHLWHLAPRPGYVGAVAVRGAACVLVDRSWTDFERVEAP